MHAYYKNIGDYAKKTGRLSMLQHGAYTLLMDACYDREQFPTEAQALEWCWASTPEEEQAVLFILKRFFQKQDDGTYVQSRIYDEIEAYKINGLMNKLIALSREAKKQNRPFFAGECDTLREHIKHAPLSKSHAAWTDLVDALIQTHDACKNVNQTINHKPLTINHKPIVLGANAPVAAATDGPGDLIENLEPNLTDNPVNPTSDQPDRQGIPYGDIFDLFNRVCVSLPKIKQRDESRRRAVKSIWKLDAMHRELDFFEWYFNRVEKSDFLTGRKTDFKSGFDWIMKPANFRKIVEGNYDNP